MQLSGHSHQDMDPIVDCTVVGLDGLDHAGWNGELREFNAADRLGYQQSQVFAIGQTIAVTLAVNHGLGRHIDALTRSEVEAASKVRCAGGSPCGKRRC